MVWLRLALAPHKVFEGNRSSSTFLYKKWMIALYEHKVFVQGVVWNAPIG
jgi:glucose-6-phosphate isomerase